MEPGQRLKLLASRADKLLAALDRRESLLEDMRKLGSEIDEAYRAAAARQLSSSEREQLERLRTTKQRAIENLRAKADAIVLACFQFHEDAANHLLEAAREDPALLPLADQARVLALSRRRDTASLKRNLIAARQLLNEAQRAHSSPPPAQPVTPAPAPTTSTGPALLTARQLAEQLQVSEKTIYRLADQGRIPSIRVGGSLRFPKDQIEAWLRQGRCPRKVRLRPS